MDIPEEGDIIMYKDGSGKQYLIKELDIEYKIGDTGPIEEIHYILENINEGEICWGTFKGQSIKIIKKYFE